MATIDEPNITEEQSKAALHKALQEFGAEAREPKEEPQEQRTTRQEQTYLRAKRVLSPSEFAKYKRAKIEEQRRKFMKVGKRKPLNVYELAKRARKDFQNEREYRQNLKEISRLEKQRRFEASRTGKVGAGISRGIKFVQGKPLSLAQARARQQAALQLQRRMQLPTENGFANAAAERQHFNWMFSNFQNPQFNVAAQVEREVSGLGNASHQFAGDAMARQMEREISSFSNFAMFLPTANVEREVNHFANLQHQNSIADVDRQVDFFSKILSPVAPKRRRR